MTDARHAAWSDIHDLLPEGWVTGPTSYDPGAHLWSITARAPNTGVRGKPSASITGEGEDELAALTDLVARLREYGRPDHMAALERRARQAFVRGAEDASREATGRGLTGDELRRVVEHYGSDG